MVGSCIVTVVTTVHDAIKRTEAETTAVKKCPGQKAIFDTSALEELKNLQFLSSHNIRVWHTPAEEFNESCLVSTIGPIIPIHGHINGEIYVKLMRKHAIPAICISMLPWLLQSLDLNPLENLWQKVKSHLCSSLNKPTSIKDLEEKVKTAWN
ncbi:17453_t:CDS:2 [Cetraspora pellucida]|uniref:17453_t:CDS:1 n=1 Tax=Cetraspora pellucida TaxID=1433469 RepID=A0A9N9I7L3_9GLOM|nr:17453_t:CDS:2 [Cetraspora pellucida]